MAPALNDERLLTPPHAIFAARPAIVAPDDYLERGVNAARNAAEHLLDIGQVDEPVEAIREALAAAEAIMDALHAFVPGPQNAADQRALIAWQMREFDATLAGLKRRLHIPAEQRHVAH